MYTCSCIPIRSTPSQVKTLISYTGSNHTTVTLVMLLLVCLSSSSSDNRSHCLINRLWCLATLAHLTGSVYTSYQPSLYKLNTLIVFLFVQLCVIQGASDCKTAPPLPPIPQADRTLYDTILTHPLKAVAELNNVREITSSFQAMLSMFKAYPSGECLLNAYISLIYVYG